MAAIVRVLWGEPGPEQRFGKVWANDVQRRLDEGLSCEQHVYVYGRDNADKLTKAHIPGLNIVLVDDDPFPDGLRDHRRESDGNIIRPWHYKLLLLKVALKYHNKIIYCDWDVRCLSEYVGVPFTFMDGREIALSAYMYKRPRFPDRATRRDKRFSPSGNWMYMTNSNFIEAILARMNKGNPWDWHDELVMGRYLDELHGGWMGEKTWLERYESPVMCQRENRTPWKLAYHHGNTIHRETPTPFLWWRYFTQ